MTTTPAAFERLSETSWYAHEAFASAGAGVCGAGGIGARVAVELARLGVGRVLLIDPDVVEETNLGRTFVRSDLGQRKVAAVKAEIERLGLATRVTALAGDVAYDLSWGMASGLDLLIGALDNRAARVALNQLAWRAGCTLIDSGQDGESLTAVARVFVPCATGPCYQCGMYAADYARLGEHFSCTRDQAAPPMPTSGIEAGAAAALVASLSARVLLGGARSLAGREYRLSLRDHSFLVTGLQRNPGCWFDHRVWPGKAASLVAPAPVSRMTCDELAHYLSSRLAGGFTVELDRDVASGFTCSNCAHVSRSLVTVRHGVVRCERCGQSMVPSPMSMTHSFTERELRECGATSLGDVLPDGHVLWASQNGQYTMVVFPLQEASRW